MAVGQGLESDLRRIFGQRGTGASDTRTVVVGGLELRDVRPLHEGRPTALTQVGRLSLRATTRDGRDVKITELHGPAHVELVTTLSRTSLEDVLPTVLTTSGSVIVTAWMPLAAETSPVTPQELARLLTRIHTTPPPDLPAGFDYFDDFLVPRARQAARTLDADQQLDRALRVTKESAVARPLRVAHPDLTPKNVLRTARGELVIIDNELLGLGRTPLLDVCNLARSIEREDRAGTVDTYLAEEGLTLDDRALVELRAMWLVRMVGAFHIAGRLAEVARLLSEGPEHLLLPFESRS